MTAALPRTRGAAASTGYTYSQGPEEVEERVICSEPTCDNSGILQPGQRLLLHCEIGFDVPLGPRQTLMAEPQRNPADVHIRLQPRALLLSDARRAVIFKCVIATPAATPSLCPVREACRSQWDRQIQALSSSDLGYCS